VDGVHDMGGMHGFGPVVVPGGEDPYHERWEPRVFAIHILIGHRRLVAGPGGRAVREEMDPAAYLAASYYERWLFSAERLLERGETISSGEVARMMQRIEAGEAPATHRDPAMATSVVADLKQLRPMEPALEIRFAPGQRVRVKRMHPPGHTRCPRYVRGACGVVEAVRGADRLPDRAAYGERVDPEPVYSVAFRSSDLWGHGTEPPWTVSLDLWDSYLERA
jgi:nitrile hydratase subunit beta